jgi:uncharacterized membrane protein YtjA (UPF0391 family)
MPWERRKRRKIGFEAAKAGTAEKFPEYIFHPINNGAAAGYACGARINRAVLQGGNMLYWAAVFFVIALVAALLGFAGIATAAAGVAKLLFYVFLVIFLVTLVMGLGRRGRV